MIHKESAMSRPTIHIDRQPNGYTEFELHLRWGDTRAVLEVRVIDEGVDLKCLMGQLIDSFEVIDLYGPDKGVFCSDDDETGERLVLAEWRRRCVHREADEYDFFAYSGGRRVTLDLDDDTDIAVAADE